MIGRGAILATISGFRTPGPDRPKNRSAPSITSSNVRWSEAWAYSAFCGVMSAVRPAYTSPSISQSQTFSRFTPSFSSMFKQAMPAAPPPVDTTLISSNRFPATCSALKAAAPTTMAVPCWSSWNTGIFIRSRHSFSTIKQSGALISSRLIAPKVGSNAHTMSASFSGSDSFTSISKQSMLANFLNRTALPSITGLDASAPIFPSPRTAVPLDTTATKFPREV